MDLARMLEKCRRDQWSADDLDWGQGTRAMPREKEIAVVQYFTNMAGIERLAAALFEEQARRATDPTLRSIFESFVADELRHADVAERLAGYYDVHRYQRYRLDPHFEKFYPAFVNAIRYLTPEVANVYITTGELVLDVALLRSLDDYVNDAMSSRAMELINRDESRHIAVDFHMVEHYSSEAYLAARASAPRRPLGEQLRGWQALALMLFHARPFLQAVFFEPMDLVDPSGKRLLEAFKRIQLIAEKPRVAKRPFVRFMLTLQAGLRHPVLGLLFGRALLRVIGTDARFARRLYSDEEAERARNMSFDEMATEAMALKHMA